MHLGVTSMLARVETRRAWRTLVALGLLAGAALGIGLTAAHVARRTATAYDRLVAATGAADATVLVGRAPPASAGRRSSSLSRAQARDLAQPGVTTRRGGTA